ncbi:hypothetical protein FB45DRAFT_301449 [Roridomyces roridus]|uniref:F-box domain-containing protein n=1 Tax=Roridomyces roridus TaxID=1738132 RepID=A0AAD7CD78_9AGAR|nr:hypothetical protein FB45DRAFT_301449 [Roridomyces roridus]
MDMSTARSDTRSFTNVRALWRQATKVFKKAPKSTSTAVVDQIRPKQSAYIFTLPTEILMEILVLSCEVDDENETLNQPTHNIPLHLVQICAPLRDLALHTPELWSSITISLDHTSQWDVRATANLVESWFAKGRPGSLRLRILSSDYYHHTNELSPLLKLITSRAHDWRSLSLIHCPDGLTKDVVYEMTQHSFDSLEEIEIHAFASMSGVLFTPLRPLPKLSAVHLRTTCIPTMTQDVALLFLPWQQLSILRVAATLLATQFLENLVGCSQLRVLEVYISCDEQTARTPQIELPNLTQLSLTLFSAPAGSSAEYFLRRLVLPALDNLDLCFIGRHTWTPLASGFWSTYAGQLHTLTLSNVSFETHSIAIDVLASLTSLRWLKLVGRETRLMGSVFKTLQKHGSVLSRLERLDVGVVDSDISSEPPCDALRSFMSFLRVCPSIVYAHVVDWTDVEERRDDVLDAEVEIFMLQTELRASGVDVRWRRRGSASGLLSG